MTSKTDNGPRPVDGASGLPFSRLVAGIEGEGSHTWDVHVRARELEAEEIGRAHV